MPDKPLTNRLIDSMIAVLGDVDDLAGVTIREESDSAKVETPFIVVGANRLTERVHGSGAYDVELRIHLKTTSGEGPKASTDADLLKLDGGIEEALFSLKGEELADVLTANGEGLRVDDVFDQSSEATEFTNVKREIAYRALCVCMAVPVTP